MVEVKRLAVKNTEGHRSQLCSYMRQLKLNVGLLINDSIHIFFDDESSKVPIEILNIEIKESDNNGDKFVEFFSKNSFSKEKIANFCINQSKKQDIVDLITADEYKDKILGFLKKDLATNFSSEAIEMALGMIEINISSSDDSPAQILLPDVESNDISLAQPDTNSATIIGIEDSENDKINNEIARVKQKLPRWLNKPEQINAQILIKAMGYLMTDEIIGYQKLEKDCARSMPVDKFKTNFISLSRIYRNNHAKIFDKDGDSITLWPPVKEFIKEMYLIFMQKR